MYLSLYIALQPFAGPWPLFSFLILYTVGRTPWTEDQPVARPLPIHRTTQTQNKSARTSMPWVGFEPTIPVFEGPKTVHALDSAAAVIGWSGCINPRIIDFCTTWKWVMSLTPPPLYPGKELDDAGWAPEPVWTTWRGEKYFDQRAKVTA
jgi:hypothetical protein